MPMLVDAGWPTCLYFRLIILKYLIMIASQKEATLKLNGCFLRLIKIIHCGLPTHIANILPSETNMTNPAIAAKGTMFICFQLIDVPFIT